MDSTDDQYPKAPAKVRQAGPDAGSLGAQEVINANSGDIAAFVHAQRQNVARSIIDHHEAKFTGPGVDVHYTNHRGDETVRVTPHPQPVTSSPVEQVVQELATEGVPIPEIPLSLDHPSKYLMVLYKTKLTAAQPERAKGDGIAAFKMDDLTPTGCGPPVYNSIAPKCEWVEQVGEIVQVGQYEFNGVGWISTQLDFTGKHRATGVWVSTTGLFDAIATPADIQAPLAMNAGSNKDAGVITAGGQVFLNSTTKQLNIGGTWASVSGVTLPPYAIDTDSTGYFFTLFQGDAVHLSLDPKSNLLFLADPDFTSSVNDKVNDGQGSIDDPTIAYVTKSVTMDDTEGSHFHDTYDFTITVLLWGDNKLFTHVDGVSYYGTAKPGSAPAVQQFKLAESPTDVEAYDVSANHTIIKTIPPGEGNTGDFGGHFPIPTYQLGGGTKGSDNVYVSFPPITATGTYGKKLTLKTDKDSFTSFMGPNQMSTGAQTVELTGGFFSGTITTNYAMAASYLDTLVYPTHAFFGSDVSGFETFYSSILATAVGYSKVKSSHTYNMVTVDAVIGGGSAVITAEFTNAEDAPFPVGCTVVSSTSGGVVTTGASDEHIPYHCGSTENLYHVEGNIQAWGTTIQFRQTHDPILGNLNHAEPPGMTVHAHPPAFTKTGAVIEPYYTFVLPDQTGGDGPRVITIHTPYGEHQGQNDLSFTPWMHVSNGKHCIQAYYVDDQPYAFVDGSNKDGFLDAIAKSLKCEPTEIVAMFMDIELRTVKQVANVQPPDYSTSQIPAPGVPGS